MPFYHQLGNIPHKRHTVFKKPDGNHYYEELFGTVGFDGMSSLLYHCERPTQVKKVLDDNGECFDTCCVEYGIFHS